MILDLMRKGGRPAVSAPRGGQSSSSRHRHLGLNPGIEGLEGRRLLSGGLGLTQYPLANSISDPQEIVSGPDGNLWFLEANPDTIGRITPSGSLTEYPLGTSGSLAGSIFTPTNLTVGPDGALWFTGTGAAVGRITTDGQVSIFPLPAPPDHNPLGVGSQLGDIAAGPDGNLWVSVSDAGTIDRISPGGTVTVFPIPTVGSDPQGITAGPDGALWFTESAKIGRITTDGQITEFSSGGVTGSGSIVAGSDGALWFTGPSAAEIGRITTSGSVTAYSLPGSSDPRRSPAPGIITAGPDGALWFTEPNGNAIGRITTSGQVSVFPLPAVPDSAFGYGNLPQGIATGADGALWFTERSAGQIARLDPKSLTSYAEGATFYTNLGTPIDGTVATIVDTSPGDTASDFSATIDWGDGQTSTGTVVSAPSGGFLVTGTHDYWPSLSAFTGKVFTIAVTVNDTRAGGATLTATGSADVYNSAPPSTDPNGSGTTGWTSVTQPLANSPAGVPSSQQTTSPQSGVGPVGLPTSQSVAFGEVASPMSSGKSGHPKGHRHHSSGGTVLGGGLQELFEAPVLASWHRMLGIRSRRHGRG